MCQDVRMKVSIKRGVAILAPFVLFELGYPLAVDQGLFRYNPYLLPAIGASGVVLYLILLFHNPLFKSKVMWIIENFSITMSFVILASFVTLTTFIIVRGYFSFLGFTKIKIAESKKRDSQQSIPQLPINIPSAAEIADEVTKRTPKSPVQRAIVTVARYTEDDGILIFKDPQHTEPGWLMNVWCKNVGPVMAKNVSCRFYENAIIAENGVPTKETLTKGWDAYKHSPVSKPTDGDDLSPNDARFGTTPIGPAQVDPALNSGERVIFVAGAMWYGDDAGSHKKELCVWAQPPFSPPHPLWHSCEIGHNREVY
jgi:hypothetical protein